ncbi:hypothetical protein MNBD_IGNAVI01-2627 [hydrothermal vent metagenome]|uniref:PDZ domain-containing protein n=1 Tax=hydrothermal vent metagenome TaxID=652676 RepID=A0A3B1CJV1_9ZZZZ
MNNYPRYVLGILLLLTTFVAAQEFDTERIPIGDQARKYNFCSVKLDKILDTKSNKELTFDNLISELGNYRIVMIGETHTNQLHHDVQFDIIKGLTESGKKVILALEMFNSKQDEALAKWSSGETDESTFMQQTNFLVTWSHNYRYYKAIFDYTREKHIPMYGVNVERKYASKIGRGGLSSLTSEEKAAIPEVDTSNIEHRFFVKVAMEGMSATMPAQFNNMYQAQSLWDTAMGEGAIKAAKENPDAVVVVLAGSGHVVYNLGIGRIIKDRSDLPFASVVTVDVPDKSEESTMMMMRKDVKKEGMKTDSSKNKKMDHSSPHSNPHSMMGMDSTPNKIVIRSLGDYLWGKKEMKQDKYPAFGFSINEFDGEGFPIKRVLPNTIAYENGLRKGDIILAIDGTTFKNSFELKKYLQFKNWDEKISFELMRDGEKENITFIIKPVEKDED